MWLGIRLLTVVLCVHTMDSTLLAAEAVKPEQSGWEYGMFLDAAYGLNFNFPENHQWRSKQTTPRTNELAPNMGLVYVRKEPSYQSRWGTELALQAGYDTKDLVPHEAPV